MCLFVGGEGLRNFRLNLVDDTVLVNEGRV